MFRGHGRDATFVSDADMEDIGSVTVCMHHMRTKLLAQPVHLRSLFEVRPGRQFQRSHGNAGFTQRPQERMSGRDRLNDRHDEDFVSVLVVTDR
jgi:hypothetical protein